MPSRALAGARGAAAIAATGLGWQPSVWAAAKGFDRSSETVHAPNPARRSYFERRFALFRDAYRRNAGWFRRSFESASYD